MADIPRAADIARRYQRRTARLAMQVGHVVRELAGRAGARVLRALTCFWKAVLGLRWFRDRTDPSRLGRDHRISRATAYRYVDEIIAVLAEQAPDLQDALQQAHDDAEVHYLVLDGTVITSNRLSEKTTSVRGKTIDLWYSGKAAEHGGNIQAISAPNGFPLWVSDVEPGSVHDLTVAREHVLAALYAAASRGLPTLADGGYEGTGIGVNTPIKQPGDNQTLDADNRTYNALLRGLRRLGERGFALLTGRWRTLQHITASPKQDRQHHPSRTRADPPRTPTDVKLAEITSRASSPTEPRSNATTSGTHRRHHPSYLP